MPAHKHDIWSQGGGATGQGWVATAINGYDKNQVMGNAIKETGGGQAHENMPPFSTLYMWRRTA